MGGSVSEGQGEADQWTEISSGFQAALLASYHCPSNAERNFGLTAAGFY